MDCQYEIIGETPRGENMLRCMRADCNHEITSAYGPSLVHTNCRASYSDLMGDSLHNILMGKYGVDIVAGCSCGEWIVRMNAWGPTGCREHLDEIVDHLLNEARRRTWKIDGHPFLSIAASVGDLVASGVVRRQAENLVSEAIERAISQP